MSCPPDNSSVRVEFYVAAVLSRPSCPLWVQAELPLVPLEPALLVERRLPELQQRKRTGRL